MGEVMWFSQGYGKNLEIKQARKQKACLDKQAF